MLPSTWAEVMERFARVAGEPGAAEWLRQALRATWGVDDVTQLNRAGRALALQRMLGTVLMVEDGDLGDMVAFTGDGGRAAIARCFARRWGGIVVEGPPWRTGPGETDRPTYDDWAATAADFN